MKEQIKEIRADIDAALAAVAIKHNLASLKTGAGTYGMSNFSFKIEGVAKDGKSVEAQRYELHIDLLKLLPLGATFMAGKYTYQTLGLNSTGSKVLVKRLPDGKEFLMPTMTVQTIAAQHAVGAAHKAANAPKKRGAR